jgi:hypothetical protein
VRCAGCWRGPPPAPALLEFSPGGQSGQQPADRVGAAAAAAGGQSQSRSRSGRAAPRHRLDQFVWIEAVCGMEGGRGTAFLGGPGTST